MLYALGIIIIALIVRAFSKYKEVAALDESPLDRALLDELNHPGSVSASEYPVLSGDGQSGAAATIANVSATAESVFAEDEETWVSDLKFGDEEVENGQS